MLKRLLKIFLYTLVGLLVLFILSAALTQTRRFKNWLRDEIVQQAETTINGNLQLGRIEGNLITRFVFRDLRIELNGDTLLSVPSIRVRFSPIKLLKRQVVVTDLLFHAPHFSLRQRSDSTWNIMHLLKPAPATAPKAMDWWQIALQNVRVENGAITWLPLDTTFALVPRQMRNFSTRMRLEYANNQWKVMLWNLRLQALQPDFKLDSLAAKINLIGDSLIVENLKLCAANSRLTGQITVRQFTQPIFAAELQGLPIMMDDLHHLLPNLPINGPLQCSIHAVGNLQHIRTNFHLAHEHGRAEGNFFVLQDSVTTHYSVDASVRALNLNPYLREDTGATRLNCDIKIDGAGLTLDDLNAKLTLAIDSSQVMGNELSYLRLKTQAREKRIQANLVARSSLGELNLTGKLIDPLHRQQFELNADARHLDLAKLFANDTLRSDLSFRVSGTGKNFAPAHRAFDGALTVLPSRLPAVLVDSAYCQFHIRGPDIQLDTLRMTSSSGKVFAAGLLSLNYENHLRFRGELGDLTWAQKAVEADTLRATGTFSGSAHGPLDSLFVLSRFDLRHVKYNITAIDTLSGYLTFHSVKSSERAGGRIQLNGYRLMMGYIPLDSATAIVDYDLKHYDGVANFWQGEKNRGELEARYTFGEIGRFDVQRAELNILGQRWRTPVAGEMWMEIGEEEYVFHNFILTSGSQRLSVDGRFTYIGAEDLRFRIEGVDLATIASVIGRDASISQDILSGILEVQGHLTGSAEAPRIHGRFNLNNGRVADFVFEKWEGEFNYENENLSWQLTLYQNRNRRLTGEGYLPMNLSLNNEGEILFYDRPIRLQASTDGIDLAFLQTLTSRVKQVQGTLVFDVKLENTLAKPRSKGSVRIIDGTFAVPEYGVNYNDLQLVVAIDTSFVEVNYFEVASDKGHVAADGRLDFTKETIGQVQGSLKADNFLITRRRDLEIRLDADIRGGGDLEGASYGGNVSVVRSRFFLPALQRRSVLQLDETQKMKSTPVDCTRAMIFTTANPMQNWLQKIRGELKINIPRNTWIRGPELNVEIEGALDFLQAGEKLSLFGTITIVRGTYELYGKRFDIQKGEINFLGDLEASPQIQLEARHVFREFSAQGEQGEKRTIEVKISGDLDNPKITFLLDKEPQEEQNALAYLLFGVSFDELRYGQREGFGTGAAFSTAAQGLITGLVSQQLAQSLSRSLKLDLVEFQSGQDISQSSVLVGKYITNDLFLSLSQDFSSPEGRTMSLEYEIAKFLFLQAAHGGEKNKKTGFDFVWKLEW